jgi:DegV family protein with EDD domain
VHDTGLISTALGLLALFAARLSAHGMEAAEILSRIRGMQSRISILFVVDTLEYLAKGGRIGKAQAWMGGLFRIKPILGLEDGAIVPVARVRGRRAATTRLLELLRERHQKKSPTIAAITHARAARWADRIRQHIEKELDIAELIISETGAVVGTHVGPGAFSVVTFQPTPEELPLLLPPTTED